MSTQQVARTILEQIGGRRFVAMTGAKHFVGGPDFLAFKLPSYFAKNGINAVRITLRADDLYRVEFSKVRGLEIKPVATHDGIYWDALAPVFTTETGLATVL
jgi:hypothetical protein